jgi:hypothetical protein
MAVCVDRGHISSGSANGSAKTPNPLVVGNLQAKVPLQLAPNATALNEFISSGQ